MSFHLLGIYDGNGRHIHDRGNIASSLEDVNGFIHPEKDGADGFRPRQALHQFIADVPRG